MTLATVTALSIAPTSQASASQRTFAIPKEKELTEVFSRIEKGGGKTQKSAMDDAINKAKSRCPKRDLVGQWVLNLEWDNRKWFSADLKYYCGSILGVTHGAAITNKPNWKKAP